MQLLSSFQDSIQAYSPYHPRIKEQIPATCPVCGFPRPEGKGTYFRHVWFPEAYEIEVRQVRCRRPGCGVTISLLPSFCVPFKRYAAKVVESCLDAVLRCGDRVQDWCGSHGWTDRCTAGSWVRQFGMQSGLVSTEGCGRLGIRQPGSAGGQARRLWRALRDRAGRRKVLCVVQPKLCRHPPFLGLFRARL